MTAFAVWAPGHALVELELEPDGRRLALASREGGWWGLEVPEAGHGTRYWYRVDGGPPRPDPRSAWQPDGIDGPSAVVDHTRYRWGDQGWLGARLASSVLYELHVGTFTPEGRFSDVAVHLDHLEGLGVSAIELLPVAEFSGDRGWGYDGVLLWAPHHAYGGPDGLKALVDAAHQRGIAVVLDVVYNHLGPAGNYLGEYGPYFTDRYRTPWGSAVNFDGPGSDEVRRFVVGNAAMWFTDYHVDGLRLDAEHAIVDTSAVPILEELAAATEALADRLGRQLWLIAESDRNDPALVRSRDAGGQGLDASWNDDFHHALHAVLTGERTGYYGDFGSLEQLARALERVYVYDGRYSPFRGRHVGRPVGGLPMTRWLGYLQNHDQVGNRALGERSASLMSLGRAKVAAALVVLGPFVPMIFQGEEWAASTPWRYFTDHREPSLAQAVTDGRARELAAFGWSPGQVPDPQDRQTWSDSVLRWSQLEQSTHAEMLVWYRRLVALRQSRPGLTDGDPRHVRVSFSEAARWLRLDQPGLVVAVNLASYPQAVELPSATLSLLLASEEDVSVLGPVVSLPPDSVAVLGG